jgi:arylsulfatase A-like enzyme
MAEGELRRPNIIFFLVDDLGWPIPLHELQNTAFVDL